jgi:hypothetical protein
MVSVLFGIRTGLLPTKTHVTVNPQAPIRAGDPDPELVT